MLLILFSLQPDSLFEKASHFVAIRNVDSAAYYISRVYDRYPTEVENLLYIAYMEDSLFGARLAKRLFPLFPESRLISEVALYELIKERNYGEIARVYEKSDSLIPGVLNEIARFYYLLQTWGVASAISLADSVVGRYDFSWYEEGDVLLNLIRTFIKDITYHACSGFLMDACYRYLSSAFPPDDDFYVENYSYAAIYGILGALNHLNRFSDILDRLRSYGYVLKNNRCRDAGTFVRVFPNLRYIRGSYAEADSVISILEWISGFCGNHLETPIRFSRIMTLPHLDMTGYALDSLRAMGDTFMDYTLSLLVDYGDFDAVKRIMDSLLSYQYVPGFEDILYRIECEEMYSDGKYGEVIEGCSETAERAYSYIMLGDRDSGLEALKYLKPDTVGDNYADYWNAGWFSLLMGDTDSAMYYTRKALDYRPENPFLTMNVGSIYFAKGLEDSALYYYTLAFERNRNRRTYHWDYYFTTWRNDVKLLSKLFSRNPDKIYRLMRDLKRRARK